MARKRRRRRRTAQEMAPLVAAWRRGEGTQAMLAMRSGLGLASFSRWCRRLAPMPSGASPRFVEVRASGGPAAGPGGHGIEVSLRSGVTLRVPAATDADTLGRLLRAVSAAC